MLSKRLAAEVALCAGFWGVIAFAITLAFGRSLWPSVPLAACMGGIFYRFPDFCRAVRTASPQKMAVPFIGILTGCCKFVYVTGLLVIALLPAQTLIFWHIYGAQWSLDWGIGYIVSVLWIVLGMGCVLISADIILWNRRKDSRPWTFPLMRRYKFLAWGKFVSFSQKLADDKCWTVEVEGNPLSLSARGVKEVIWHTVSGMVFFNFFILILPVIGLSLVLDVLMTAALACAPNERLSVSAGGAFGCAVATLLAFLGFGPPAALLGICGIAGTVGGGALYILRVWFVAHPPTFRVADRASSTGA